MDKFAAYVVDRMNMKLGSKFLNYFRIKCAATTYKSV